MNFIDSHKAETRDEDLQELFIYSHKLAHTLRDQDSDQFVQIYDNFIPTHFDQHKLDKIKEKARQLIDLDECEFKSSCSKLNCDYEQERLMFMEMYKQQNAKALSSSKSTSESLEIGEEDETVSQVEGSITLNQHVYNQIFNDKAQSSHQTSPLANLPPLTATQTTNELSSKSRGDKTNMMSRDGYVTNQRYQTYKDNKRNESQVTTCYDEVYQVDAVEDEDDIKEQSDSDEDELKANKKRDLSATSSSSRSDSTSSISSIKQQNDKTLTQHERTVVINMYDEDEPQRAKSNNNFDSTACQNDDEDESIDAMISPELNNKVNKYEQEEKLLRNLEDECRFGTKHIVSKRAIENIRQLRISMQNDFNKNDEADIVEDKITLNDKLNLPKPSTSQKSTIDAITLSKPNTASTGAGYTAASSTDDSADLLENLVTQLISKQQTQSKTSTNSFSSISNSLLPTSTTGTTSSSLQYNNYIAEVDDLINLNLTSKSNSVKHDVKKSGNMVRHSNATELSNIDSHGSSLTNSSKQDEDEDEQDMEEDEEYAAGSDEKNSDHEDDEQQRRHGKSTNNNELLDTIKELSQTHVNKSKCSSGAYSSYNDHLKGHNLSTFKNTAPQAHVGPSQSSSGGAFHKKYQYCTYDPNELCTLTSANTSNKSSATSGTTASVNYNTFPSTSTTNKANKKLQGKKSTNEEANSKSNYSEHYVDDLNRLLEFINSADSKSSSKSNQSGKEQQSKATNKSTKAKQKSTTTTTSSQPNQAASNQTLPQTAKSSKKEESKRAAKADETNVVSSSSRNELSLSSTLRSSESNPSNEQQPASKQQLNKLAERLESIELKSTVTEDTERKAINKEEENEEEREEEFVTVVHNRKLRKNQPQKTNKEGAQLPKASNLSSQGKANTTSNYSNLKKPIVTKSNQTSSSSKSEGQPSSARIQHVDPTQREITAASVVMSQNKPWIGAIQEEPIKSLHREKNEEKRVDNAPDLNTFPPLITSSTTSSKEDDRREEKSAPSESISCTKETSIVHETSPTKNEIKPANNLTNRPSETQAEPDSTLKMNSANKVVSSSSNLKTLAKNKSSVIFLDELRQSEQTQRTNQSENRLNGIKFGFIDTSSSENEDIENAQANTHQTSDISKGVKSTSQHANLTVETSESSKQFQLTFMSSPCAQSASLGNSMNQSNTIYAKDLEQQQFQQQSQTSTRPQRLVRKKYTKHKSSTKATSSSSAISSQRTTTGSSTTTSETTTDNEVNSDNEQDSTKPVANTKMRKRNRLRNKTTSRLDENINETQQSNLPNELANEQQIQQLVELNHLNAPALHPAYNAQIITANMGSQVAHHPPAYIYYPPNYFNAPVYAPGAATTGPAQTFVSGIQQPMGNAPQAVPYAPPFPMGPNLYYHPSMPGAPTMIPFYAQPFNLIVDSQPQTEQVLNKPDTNESAANKTEIASQSPNTQPSVNSNIQSNSSQSTTPTPNEQQQQQQQQQPTTFNLAYPAHIQNVTAMTPMSYPAPIYASIAADPNQPYYAHPPHLTAGAFLPPYATSGANTNMGPQFIPNTAPYAVSIPPQSTNVYPNMPFGMPLLPQPPLMSSHSATNTSQVTQLSAVPMQSQSIVYHNPINPSVHLGLNENGNINYFLL
jgi:hypothetical protein